MRKDDAVAAKNNFLSRSSCNANHNNAKKDLNAVSCTAWSKASISIFSCAPFFSTHNIRIVYLYPGFDICMGHLILEKTHTEKQIASMYGVFERL